MNAADILRYGQRTALGAVEGIAPHEWDVTGACGVWSMKDIVAHLASYERVLEDILDSLLGPGDTPYLDRFQASPAFNDAEVAARRGMTIREILDELSASHERTMALIARIPDETRRRPGTLPWYGDAYALDDLLVYMYYGHKREHSAQIAAFRDRLRAAPAAIEASATSR